VNDPTLPDGLRPSTLTDLIPGLSAESATALLAAGHRSRLHHGEVFFSQGAPSSSAGIILSGHLKLSAVGSSGRSVVLTFWGPGDFAGHVTVINATTRMGSAVAVGSVDLLVVPATAFNRILVDNPDASATMTRQLASWVEASARCQAVQGTEPANVRIARLLVDLCDTGETGDRAELALDLSQDELGQIVGVSRESVARVLREFRDQGLVLTRRRALTVLRLQELEQVAQVRRARGVPGETTARHRDERVIRRPS
jgi:CRP/FNR family cyclic AMP-dependent transcriptional regulator